jgi:hypothetical protein
MFKSFFPKPGPFFLSAFIWALIAVLFWQAGGGAWLERLTGASGDVPISAARFWSLSYLLFYAYYALCVGLFALFWFAYSPHRWQYWSILGTALIIFVTWFLVEVGVAVNAWYAPFYDLIQTALSSPHKVTLGQFYHEVGIFLGIALIAVIIGVMNNFFVSHYVFRWRTAGAIMNKIYRLIWNPALHAWVAVSEFAKANGKGKAGRKSLSATTVGIIGALTLLPMVSASAYADDPDSVKMGTNAVTGETTILDANTITTGNTNVNEQTLSNVAIGESANAAMGGTALGDHANADTSTSSTPGGSVAIGAYATANKSGGATAIGLASEADGQNSVAFGAGAHANRSGDIAIGHGSTSGTYTSTQTTDDAEGENISFGNLSTAYGGHALAVGNNVAATAAYSMALGIGSQASGVKSLSIGSDAKSSAEHSLAIGSDAAASGENAQAIGGSATASGETSLAIGNHASATDKQSFAVGYKAQSTKADAVAIGTQAKAQADRALSFGYNSSATKSDAVAMGSNAKSQGMSSLAFGTNAISANANSVALGSNSLTEAAVATQDITINDKIYAFAGTAPLSTVSIGKKDAERTLTNVAAGRISNTSTDAINGSQLFAATQATDALGDIAVKYDLNPDGSANYDSITLGGTAYDSVGETGGTAITNVARGSAFLPEGFDGGKVDRHTRRNRPDRGGDAAGNGAFSR